LLLGLDTPIPSPHAAPFTVASSFDPGGAVPVDSHLLTPSPPQLLVSNWFPDLHQAADEPQEDKGCGFESVSGQNDR